MSFVEVGEFLECRGDSSEGLILCPLPNDVEDPTGEMSPFGIGEELGCGGRLNGELTGLLVITGKCPPERGA